MTPAELLSLIADAKTASNLAWQSVVAVEAATGPLKQLTNNQEVCLRAYDMATEQISKSIPNVPYAELLLSGAQFLESQRAGAQSATDALQGLSIYGAAPYYGSSEGSSWAAAVNVST